MFVSCVHPVAVLNAAFCMTCSFVNAGRGCNRRPYRRGILQVPTTPACTWWNRPEEDLSSGKSESTHPCRTVVKSIEVFYGVESVVRGNADSLLN